jgi:flavin-dependent dehydrogenase
VVVGDAAAFIETYIQGALMYGYSAGKAAAAYLREGIGLEGYAGLWQKSFEYNDPQEIKQATQGFGLHVLDDGDLDYLFSLTRGDDIKGYVNEFSDAATVRSAIMRHIDRIKSDRPALAQRIETFADVSVDDALQVNS